MLNAERFKEEILNIVNDDFYISVNKNNPNGVSKCGSFPCTDCMFSKLEDGKIRCTKNRMNWLLSEYKEPVKLTRLEYGILKFLLNDTGYRYIARNKYRHEGGVYNLYIFKDEPFEDSGVWCSGRDSGNEFYVFNNLFAFVKWEDSKPTSIEDVLNNCEVVNGAEE